MKAKEIIVTALFSAVICICSVIALPIGTVPITLSLFGIFVTSSLLKPKCAVFAVLVYIISGVIGLPVFSGFGSGFSTLFGPTGGFIFAYPIMAAVISLSNAFFKKNKIALPISMFLSLIICYLSGALWYCAVTNVSFTAALTVCVVPFVLFDIIKVIAALTVVFAVKKSPIQKLLT